MAKATDAELEKMRASFRRRRQPASPTARRWRSLSAGTEQRREDAGGESMTGRTSNTMPKAGPPAGACRRMPAQARR